MDKRKMITLLSIVATTIIIAVATVLIINRNNSSKKTVATGSNMDEKEQVSTEEPTEEPSEEPLEEESPSPSPTASPKPNNPVGKYYIKVNNQMNTVTIYVKDANGNYTIPVKAMVCSTGYASPKNSKYQLKGRWTWGEMIGGVYTQWETHITGNILFHSVPYLRRYDYNSLEYWAYDKLGTTCSAGCIRLTCADAKWIYDNCPTGTWVEFYSSPNPGPLGKPSAMKISSYTEYRGWDPTDPHKGNPWRNAVINVPSPEPTIIPTPDVIPSEEPTQAPTNIPTVKPSVIPTNVPTSNPSVEPSKTPTPTQTPQPSAPSKTPTPEIPSPLPSELPSIIPSVAPIP